MEVLNHQTTCSLCQHPHFIWMVACNVTFFFFANLTLCKLVYVKHSIGPITHVEMILVPFKHFLRLRCLWWAYPPPLFLKLPLISSSFHFSKDHFAYAQHQCPESYKKVDDAPQLLILPIELSFWMTAFFTPSWAKVKLIFCFCSMIPKWGVSCLSRITKYLFVPCAMSPFLSVKVTYLISLWVDILTMTVSQILLNRKERYSVLSSEHAIQGIHYLMQSTQPTCVIFKIVERWFSIPGVL